MKLIVAHSQSAVGYWDPVCACDSASGGSAQGWQAFNWKKKQKNNSLKSWNEIKSSAAIGVWTEARGTQAGSSSLFIKSNRIVCQHVKFSL